MAEEIKITRFTQLVAWRTAHLLVLEVYKLTESFPKNTFSLIDQQRRSSLSISSNIAEGFSRRNKKEKIQFYYIAKGSLTELQNQLTVSKDLKYIEESTFNLLSEKADLIYKLINGLIYSAETKNS